MEFYLCLYVIIFVKDVFPGLWSMKTWSVDSAFLSEECQRNGLLEMTSQLSEDWTVELQVFTSCLISEI